MAKRNKSHNFLMDVSQDWLKIIEMAERYNRCLADPEAFALALGLPRNTQGRLIGSAKKLLDKELYEMRNWLNANQYNIQRALASDMRTFCLVRHRIIKVKEAKSPAPSNKKKRMRTEKLRKLRSGKKSPASFSDRCFQKKGLFYAFYCKFRDAYSRDNISVTSYRKLLRLAEARLRKMLSRDYKNPNRVEAYSNKLEVVQELRRKLSSLKYIGGEEKSDLVGTLIITRALFQEWKDQFRSERSIKGISVKLKQIEAKAKSPQYYKRQPVRKAA